MPKGIRVSFFDGQVLMCLIGNTIEHATVIGEEYGGLYKLKGQSEQALVHESIESNKLWHRRLAHVHYRALPLAKKDVEGLSEIQSKHDGVCKGCAKGKNRKKTFPSSKRKAKRNLGNHSLQCMWSNVIQFIKRVCILCFFQ